MDRPRDPLQSALATLQTRWGSAAVRLGDGRPVGASAAAGSAAPAVHGALALSVVAGDPLGCVEQLRQAGVISTGFPALDAILGPSGLPAEVSAVIRGGPSSGKTTLALRCIAEAQASGDIVAYLDLARTFDPVDAVGRGVDLRWLLIVRPADTAEGFALAGSLLSGRCVGLLVVDLPAPCQARTEELLRRLTAHARRVGARLIVLEPVSVAAALQAALTRDTGLAPGAGATRLATPGPGCRGPAHHGGGGQEPLRPTGSQRGPGHPLPHGRGALDGGASTGLG